MKKCLVAFLILVLSMVATAEWNFRGTANNWGNDEMTYNSETGLYEISQTFANGDGGGGPRFKIDRYGNWSENYPGEDYTVEGNKTYKITIDPSTHEVNAILNSGEEEEEEADTWYLRGTSNSWGTTLMDLNESTGLYETSQTFANGDGGGGPRFKISHDTNWGENYPNADYTVEANKTYTVTFNANTKEINAVSGISAPTVSASPEGGEYTEDSIAVSISTAGEGITESKYKIDNLAWISFESSKNINLDMSGLENGETKTIKVSATNSAGTNEETYTFTKKVQGEGMTLYYQDTNNWSNVYIYAYTDSGTVTMYTGGWPGTEMTADGNDWYKYDFGDIEGVKIIFTNNSGSQVPGSGEAGFFQSNTAWYDGVWHDTDPRVDNEAPTISANPASGNYEATTLTVSLIAEDNQDSNPKVYYTTNGTTATQSSTLYTNGISISDNGNNVDGIIKAIAVDASDNQSEVFTFEYRLNEDSTAPTVSATPGAGQYENAQTIYMTVSDNQDSNPLLYYTKDGSMPARSADQKYNGEGIYVNTTTTIRYLAVDEAGNERVGQFSYVIGDTVRGDFREETVYFLMTTRFYNGDTANDFYCWEGEKAGNIENGDPAWRGDFKGLAEKLDYIKALGFSAVWLTPVVKNMSGYDYHGYHAVDFKQVDPRYESSDFTYQDLIDTAHSKGIKILQDIVLNHSSNFGDERLYPLFQTDGNGDYVNDENAEQMVPNNLLQDSAAGNYDGLEPYAQYQARLMTMKDPQFDTSSIYHHENSLSWNSYEIQSGQMADDCVDLNTENPETIEYLIDAYNHYIDMGVDGFRVDTVKHMPRLMLNKYFNPAFKERGGENFYMAGEVCARYWGRWNEGVPAISPSFYTWKETENWTTGTLEENTAAAQAHFAKYKNDFVPPVTNNHSLNGNDYHTPDWSLRSGMDQIDFPMHWAFRDARSAFGVALSYDSDYNDATWNMTYVDSHDYAPDGAPENQRFAGDQSTWAENLSLMFTFRGIPTIYYGSEIEFKKGHVIDEGPNIPLEESGRAYFGDKIEGTVNVSDYGVYSNATGSMASTLAHPLAQHIRRLNLIRRAVPALQKGQYSISDINAGGMAFKRRYTADGVDSFALVVISGDATFNNIPSGRYVDVVTGDVIQSSGSLYANAGGKGNIRVYVMDTALTSAPGVVGESGTYIK